MLCHQHILWIIYVIRKDRFSHFLFLFHRLNVAKGFKTHTFQSLNYIQFMWWCNKHRIYYSKFYTRLIYYVTAFSRFLLFILCLHHPKSNVENIHFFKVSISHVDIFPDIFAEKMMMIKAKTELCNSENRWFNKTQNLCNHFVLDIFLFADS